MANKTLAALKPNAKNPRTITDKKAKMLRDSLARFGDLSGIVVNTAAHHHGKPQIIGGHQRIKAFQGLGASDVTITKTYDTPSHAGTVAEGYVDISGERYAYREVQWNEHEEKAANLAANKGAGEWDLGQVAEWVAELVDVDFDVDLTMFDADERDALVPDTEVVGEQLSEDDESPVELLPEPKTRPGDMYLMSDHRLLCGDSSNVQHLDLLMAGYTADMVYTDPPYGMNYKAEHKGRPEKDRKGSRKWRSANNFAPIIGDANPFDPSFMLGYFSTCTEMFLWGADYYGKCLPESGSWIVWDKRTKADGEAINQYNASEFELCWSKKKHHRQIARILWAGLCGVNEGKRVHPTQKPVALHEWFLERFGQVGDTLVDLYGGSGSTLLACEKHQRKCHMMEIDPGYCDVIVARWEKLTGQQAKLLSSGGEEAGDGG